MVDKIVVMSVKALFPNDQGEVKNILRENNRNTEKQLEQRREKKWKKFIDRPNYGYYVPNENPDEKSVIEPTQIIERMQSVDNIKSELHKNIAVCKGKKKNYKMETNNKIGNMELSEHHGKSVKFMRI